MRISDLLVALAFTGAVTATAHAQVKGACCLPGGGCIEQTDFITCVGNSGAFMPGVPCIAACGACCTFDGGCQETSASVCGATGGNTFTPGATCEEVCAGGCCLPGGACSVMLENACINNGGTFLGPGTSCVPGQCSPPFSPAFTYQGQLLSDGAPVEGLADLEFRLYDAPTDGSVVDTYDTQADVHGGLFTADVAMSPASFDGGERWLEIDVRVPAGAGSFQTLSPRVRVSPTPYALQVRGLYVDDALRVGIGTKSPNDPLTVAGIIGVNGTASSNGGALRTYGPNSLNTLTGWTSADPDHGYVGVYDEAGNWRANMFADTSGAGKVRTSGPNSVNIDLTYLSGNPDNGYIAVRDPNGQNHAALYVGSNGAGGVQLKDDSGSAVRLSANGTSYFTGGNVGIGVDNPNALLVVQGEGNVYGNHIAVFRNTSTDGTGDGIAIQLKDPVTSKQNNFITFLNGQGLINGRIEGFDFESGDWQPPPVTFNVNFDIDFDPGSLPSADFDPGSLPSLETDLPFDITFHAGSLPSLDFEAGSLPSIGVNAFTFDLPTQQQMTAMFSWAQINGIPGFLTLDPVSLAANALKVAAMQASRDGGVTYGSKGADYAEWLPKRDPAAKFQFGQVVGVRDGKISLNTEGADSIMATSQAPVVLGNVPPDGHEAEYEKVAFMGQVQVVVRGRVAPGDYIVPSGLNDGTGIAISPDDLSVDRLGQVLGRAWSASTNDVYSFINVAVGLDDNGTSLVLAKQQAAIDAQARENAQLRAELDDLKAAVAELTHAATRDHR